MSVSDMLQPDMERICAAEFVPWDKLRGRTVFVTGATGLIGYTLVNALLYASEKRSLDIHVMALVRDAERAKARFSGAAGAPTLVVGTVEDLPEIPGEVDYIIHGASQTASRAFVKQPVETIQTAVSGTGNVLELARRKGVLGLVYLSSMEVYGFPPRGHKVTEDEAGAFSPLDVRNSYPVGKLLSENLCCAYASEYGVPAVILRLTQTFGPGVNYNDERIFAEFARCVLEKRDIILKTKGETERSYLCTADAATAILTVLLKGEPGTAYNAADESTYCSIAEVARRVAILGNVGMCFHLEDTKQTGYPRPLYMDLDTSRLRELGWAPAGLTLEQMLENVMCFYEVPVSLPKGDGCYGVGRDKASH